MKIKISDFKNLEFTKQGKGVFWATFSISTLLFVIMRITEYSSVGYFVIELSGLSAAAVGFLNFIIALDEFQQSLTKKENFRIHLNSAFLVLLNFPITCFYIVILLI